MADENTNTNLDPSTNPSDTEETIEEVEVVKHEFIRLANDATFEIFPGAALSAGNFVSMPIANYIAGNNFINEMTMDNLERYQIEDEEGNILAVYTDMTLKDAFILPVEEDNTFTLTVHFKPAEYLRRIEALEQDNNNLMLALLEMSELVYA